MNYRKKFLELTNKFPNKSLYSCLGMLIELKRIGHVLNKHSGCLAEDFRDAFPNSAIKPEGTRYCSFLLKGKKLSDCSKEDIANALID